MRTLIATLLAFSLGAGLLFFGTDGLRAFTSESARRLAVSEHPRLVATSAVLQDSHGRAFRMADHRGQVLFVEFIYTTCPMLCQAMGENFGALQKALETLPPAARPLLLSISFDLYQDTPERLSDYAEWYGADSRLWKIARTTNQRDLTRLLDDFAVKIIPDPLFGFQHNAAVHVVDEHGRLIRIVDVSVRQALDLLRWRRAASR